ncbi:MAG: hypothetical protein ACRD0U_15520, partial [Acidimicrobiales bacterium]
MDGRPSGSTAEERPVGWVQSRRLRARVAETGGVIVKLQCGRCERVVARLYGDGQGFLDLDGIG